MGRWGLESRWRGDLASDAEDVASASENSGCSDKSISAAMFSIQHMSYGTYPVHNPRKLEKYAKVPSLRGLTPSNCLAPTSTATGTSADKTAASIDKRTTTSSP